MSEPINRARVAHDVTRETRRLAQHIRHLSVEEVKALDSIVDELALIHADDEACANLCRRHGDHHPPWGTRYAGLLERVWRSVFPNAWLH